MPFSQSVTILRGVGNQIAAQLANLNIHTVEDVALHLPFRYEDRTRITPIAELRAGEHALINGTLQSNDIKMGKRRSLVCLLNDGTGTLMLRFFHFSSAQRTSLQVGTTLRCYGEIRQGYHCLELIHPEYQVLNEAVDAPDSGVANLTPVYPSTGTLTQSLLRALVEQVLTHYPLPDYLPADLLQQQQLPPLSEALQSIHSPAPDAELDHLLKGTHPARKRLAFEELLAHHLSLRTLRQQITQRPAPSLLSKGNLVQRLLISLPFNLTHAQQRTFNEIVSDLRQPHPMQRLVQGDVGSGKTIVAALSALQAIEAGYQVAVMAPTELLAEQHMRTFSQWLWPLALKTAWLAGSLTKKKREQALAEIASGAAQLVVGTHALFQKEVQFASLGLVIVDEQHRFGVHQRLALRNKGEQQGLFPHQLIMTATPIPRTLAMTAYADLDTSIIDELPPGRTPVNTAIVPNTRRPEIIARIQAVCQTGRQAYWVCPLVEESDVLQLQAAEETATQLREALPDLNIGLVHGRMKAKDKDAVMESFKNAELDLLVATTVIEVGVDVPNASLMIIENAERLGLAQLHQLRGRVGRGQVVSHCVLLYQLPLSELAQARLAIMRETNDGFMIAQRDLELRGPGEVLGTKQTGVLNFKTADLKRDAPLMTAVQQAGQLMANHYPDQCPALIARWVKQALDYGEV